MATDYRIEVAKAEHKHNIYNLMVNSFYPDMPLFFACNIKTPSPIEKWPALQTLDDGMTLIAMSPHNEIQGVAIHVAPKFGMAISGPTILGRFWEFILEDSKGLVSHLENTTIELRILTVAQASRGKGIAKRLVLESEHLAKRLGHKSVFATATGALAETAFKRNGWKCAYTLMYKDYATKDPEFVLPPEPHDRFTLYIKEFSD